MGQPPPEVILHTGPGIHGTGLIPANAPPRQGREAPLTCLAPAPPEQTSQKSRGSATQRVRGSSVPDNNTGYTCVSFIIARERLGLTLPNKH